MENEEKKEMSSSHEAAEGTKSHHDASHQAAKSTDSENPKAFKWSVLLFGLIGALVVAFLIFYGAVNSQVKKLSQQSWVLKSAAALHIPAVKAGGETLFYADYINEINSLKKLAANPSAGFSGATDQDISDLVVANFFNTLKVREVAKKLNVEATPDEVTAKKNELYTQFGGEEAVKKTILDSYGWDLDTFATKILEPAALAAEAREAFAKTTLPEAAQFIREETNVSHILVKVDDFTDKKEKAEKMKKAQGILARLKKGEDFGVLAKELSDDPGSKEQGGSLGWIPRGATVAPFEEVAFTLELGKLSELVESDFGFHIIQVAERGMRPDYDAYMDSQLKALQPEFFVPIHNPLETLFAEPGTASTTPPQGAPETTSTP